MEQALNQIFAEFAKNPVAAGMSMRRLLESDRDKFFASSLPLLRAAPETQGFNYLLTLLLMNGLILEQLTDTSLFSFSEAVHLARQLLRVEPLLDVKMVRAVLDTKEVFSRQELENKATSEKGIRLLEIMVAISDGARILAFMAQLLHHPDSRVRSKVALLVGRSIKDHRWVEQRMMETDPRVRANALESLWDVDSTGIRQVFWAATADPENRVAGNAVYGLYKLGEAASIPLMFQMLGHEQAEVRVTGIWVMGETGDPRFLPALARVMSDPKAEIRTAVFRAIGRIKQSIMKFSTAAPLDINIGHTEITTDGWIQIRLSVSLSNSSGQQVQELTGLKPTQFVIYEDSTLVSHYEVSEEMHSESLAMAFALPRTIERDGEVHCTLEQAFADVLHHKRKNDAWVTLRYLCQKERDALGPSSANNSLSGVGQRGQTEPEALAIAPNLRFSTNPEAIVSAMSAGASPLSSAPNLVRAAHILLSSVGAMRGSRQVVLVYQPTGSQPTTAECQEIARVALSARTRVHAIVPEPVATLTDLCARTGGFVLERPLEELPRSLEALYANLVSHYQIRLRCMHSEAVLKIQVFSRDGTAEKLVPLATTRDRLLREPAAGSTHGGMDGSA